MPSILLLFLRELYKFNNTDSIYHLTLKLLENHIFGVKTSNFSHYVHSIVMDIITIVLLMLQNACKTLVVYRL